MKQDTINWDDVPEVINKDQFYKLAKVSKSTARFLLKSGKVPCIYSEKKTRCYKIKKKDVIAFIEDREKYPEFYKASRGWYSNNGRMDDDTISRIPDIRDDLHEYYSFLFKDYPDVLNTNMVSIATGYGTTAVNHWCQKRLISFFRIKCGNHIPKTYLIDFCCSPYFRTINVKSAWHKRILIEYPKWKYSNTNY